MLVSSTAFFCHYSHFTHNQPIVSQYPFFLLFSVQNLLKTTYISILFHPLPRLCQIQMFVQCSACQHKICFLLLHSGALVKDINLLIFSVSDRQTVKHTQTHTNTHKLTLTHTDRQTQGVSNV